MDGAPRGSASVRGASSSSTVRRTLSARAPEPPFHLPPVREPHGNGPLGPLPPPVQVNGFIAGAWAGLVAETILHPFDTVSTRLKTQATASPRYLGFAHAWRRILAEEGVRGLYGGLGATILFQGPATAKNDPLGLLRALWGPRGPIPPI